MHHTSATVFTTLAILACASSVTPSTQRYRILALFPFAGKSHMNIFSSLTTELANRGHEVVSVNPFPLKEPIPNLKEIYSNVMEPMLNDDHYDMYSMKELSHVGMLNMMIETGTMFCELGLKIPEVQELVHEKFDLVIITYFFSECQFGLVHKLQAPFIVISPNSAALWNEYLANPEFYSYVPNVLLPFTDRMSFFQRLANTAFGVTAKVLHSWVYLPEHQRTAERYFGDSMPPIAEIQKNVSLVMLNSHVSHSYPRPNFPGIVEIGGIHIRPPKELPQDLKEFLDGAKEGVIYFSLGSIVKSSKMPTEKRQIFLDVFAQLPQRILWKWESDDLPGQPKNVKIGKWLPQTDILAHPNTRVFISHGGLLSSQEALFHGVPILGIPIMGDQRLNLQRVASAGRGLHLEIDTLTRETLLEALKALLENSSYTNNARRSSEIFRDQPQTALERAVFWTEYVLRHTGAAHLKSAAVDLAWHEYFLIDVIAFVLLVLFAVATLLYYSVKKSFRCLKTLCRNSLRKAKEQ